MRPPGADEGHSAPTKRHRDTVGVSAREGEQRERWRWRLKSRATSRPRARQHHGSSSTPLPSSAQQPGGRLGRAVPATSTLQRNNKSTDGSANVGRRVHATSGETGTTKKNNTPHRDSKTKPSTPPPGCACASAHLTALPRHSGVALVVRGDGAQHANRALLPPTRDRNPMTPDNRQVGAGGALGPAPPPPRPRCGRRASRHTPPRRAGGSVGASGTLSQGLSNPLPGGVAKARRQQACRRGAGAGGAGGGQKGQAAPNRRPETASTRTLRARGRGNAPCPQRTPRGRAAARRQAASQSQQHQ